METEQDLENLAFVAGDMAFWAGKRYTQNPYTDRNLAYRWSKGWLEAEKDCVRENSAHLAEALEDYHNSIL